MPQARLITLVERQPLRLPADAFSPTLAQQVRRQFASQVVIQPPSFLNDNQWELTAQDWIGHIPLTPALHLALQPKVPLQTVFGMLETAYDIPWRRLPGLTSVETLPDFYARLALALAELTLERARRGLWRAYVAREGVWPYVRGRLATTRLARQPARPAWPGYDTEFSADLPHNQIILWTLHLLVRSGLGRSATQATLRRAYRTLRGVASLTQLTARDALDLTYTRLNADYQPLHALCRFFLDQAGPTHHPGDAAMPPFLIDMQRLYETFVAAWLGHRLPPHLSLRTQERLTSHSGAIQMAVDLVIRDRTTGAPRLVLDTKYKTPDRPAPADLHQIAFYAQALGCHEAVLIYPLPLAHPLDDRLQQVRLRTLAFRLDEDLETAGQAWLDTLLGPVA